MKKAMIILGLLVMGACTSTPERSTASVGEGERYMPSAHERRN